MGDSVSASVGTSARVGGEAALRSGRGGARARKGLNHIQAPAALSNQSYIFYKIYDT
jgi:hypothetical protein